MRKASHPRPTALSNASSTPFKNTLVDGLPTSFESLHQAVVDAAEVHINSRHRAPCTPKTKVLFARMDFHGVGNDLNNAARALACALSQDRQVVFLPPGQADQDKNSWLRALRVTGEQPWHWLKGAGWPLDSALVLSSCHRELMRPERKHVLLALAQANDTDAATTLSRIGEHTLAKVARSWHPIWRVGLTAAVVPTPYQSLGLLWWFQVLASYLVRLRGPLHAAMADHPAMRAFMASRESAAPRGRIPTAAANFGRTHCGKRLCDDVGMGWHPPVWFDVGLHIRMGDVCGKNAPRRGQKTRRCSARPLEDALELMKSHGLRGDVFFASDSAETLAQAVHLGPVYGFNISFLAFEHFSKGRGETCSDRNSGGSVTGLEWCERDVARDRRLLVEALLDAIMLSRSTVLVGSMMSNFPRLALQLRVQAPREGVLRYLTLDGREWCTRSSCRMNYTERYGTS